MEDIFTLINSLNKLALVALIITVIIIFIQVYNVIKKWGSGKKPDVPEFKGKKSV